MLEAWTGRAVGKMHMLHITNREVAEKMGVTNRYLSMILNGHRNPPGAEQRVGAAIDEIERERNAENEAESPAC